jgi:hypothetical protein
MKFDPREMDLLAALPKTQPRPSADWNPSAVRWVRVAEAVVLACVAMYFAAAVLGIFLA